MARAVPITGFDHSIFSRKAVTCDSVLATVRSQLRSCSTKFGIGYCLDGSGQSFPYCSADNDLTLKECQNAAHEKSDAIGWEYDSVTQDCFILFDSTIWKVCPAGFTAAFDDVGTGPIQGSDDAEFTNGVECFVCSMDE